MASPALRQADLFQEPPNESDVWSDRLLSAFADVNVHSDLLPLAEQAIEARPADAVLLLLAATAALLDERPERALVFLKRFSKRAEAPAAHLLHALALNQLDKCAAAKTLLEQHELTSWPAALPAFPGGFERLPWLVRQLEGIMGRATPVSGRGSATPAKPKTANNTKSKPTPKKEAAGHPRVAPKARLRHDEPAQQIAEEASAPPPLPRVEIEIPFTMEIDVAALSSDASREPEQDGRWFGLRERLAHLGLAQGFDELLCLPHLTGFEPLWHQIETVRKVLKQFRGRVLLADEVGLGKTIEACMVLKEYALRGMAERILVLTPASLVDQWHEELESKFGFAFATTYDPLSRENPQAFWDQNRIDRLDRYGAAPRARRMPPRAQIRPRHR